MRIPGSHDVSTDLLGLGSLGSGVLRHALGGLTDDLGHGVVAVALGFSIKVFKKNGFSGVKGVMAFFLHPYGLFVYCCLATACLFNSRFLTTGGVNPDLGTVDIITNTALFLMVF